MHRDGCVSSALLEDLDWLEKKLSDPYEIKKQGVGILPGLEREGKVLNSVVACDERGWRAAADARHAEFIVGDFSLKGEPPCRSNWQNVALERNFILQQTPWCILICS